jgi:protein involved in polysaccharide export with SLBB domain
LEPARPSLFEQTLPGNLKQFGYELFNKTVSSFAPPATMPVGPDYIIGPGDQFTLTLWGTTEGIYNLKVSKEGDITLPKVGVVSVAGIRFGELERTLKRHLSAYYGNFNLSVAMGGLKTLTIYVVGEVAKPGSYSLSSLSTVYGALFAAGGPTKQGTLRAIQVLRTGKVIKTIDLYDFLLKGDRSQDVKLQNEDTVFVPLIGPVAGVAGTVYRPAIYELKGQETIGDVIQTAGGIMPLALGGRLQLTRYEDNQKKVMLDIRLDDSQPGAPKSADAFREKIQNMDAITIRPVYDKVWETVGLSGDVEHPGEYQWRPDLKVKEVVLQGQLLPTADLQRAEIIRLSTDFRDRTILPIDLELLLKGDEAQNLPLQPKDEIRVYSRYRKAQTVTLSGELMKQGTFEIKQGERLSDLLRRAGGFTPEAYPYGAVFKRVEIRNFQARQLNAFMLTMQTRLLQETAKQQAAAISPEEVATQKNQLMITQQLIGNLKAQQQLAEGRVALNLSSDIDAWAGSKDDAVLQDGDTLSVPKEPQEISVIGEVYNPGAVVFQGDQKVRDYIGLTGGYTDYAKKGDVFVVQANGFTVSKESSNGSVEKMTLRPGDAILVPQEVERSATVRTTRDIIDILFKTAVVFATIHLLF